MARKRMDTTVLKTYDDADAVLRKIGEIDRDLGMIEAFTNETIDRAKQRAKTEGEPLRASKANLERQLKEFCEARRADFADARTRELTFGSVGFRRATSVVMKSVGDTLQALLDLGLSHCIRTTQEPDKEARRELPTETLATVGAALKTTDASWYEIKREAIAEVA